MKRKEIIEVILNIGIPFTVIALLVMVGSLGCSEKEPKKDKWEVERDSIDAVTDKLDAFGARTAKEHGAYFISGNDDFRYSVELQYVLDSTNNMLLLNKYTIQDIIQHDSLFRYKLSLGNMLFEVNCVEPMYNKLLNLADVDDNKNRLDRKFTFLSEEQTSNFLLLKVTTAYKMAASVTIEEIEEGGGDDKYCDANLLIGNPNGFFIKCELVDIYIANNNTH